jgi:hypothetical protein
LSLHHHLLLDLSKNISVIMYISKVALAVGGASLVAAAPVVEKRAEITDGNTCPFHATLVVQ